MSASDLRCDNCHDSHHQPEATCLSCHKGGAKDKHPGAIVHMVCSTCHGSKAEGINEWTRQVCTVCHVDRTEHNAPADCVLCHDILPMGGNKAVASPTALHDVEPKTLLGTMHAWLDRASMPLPSGGLP